MIKILIADDDALVRLGLKTMIEWEKHGFDLIGESENGIEAYEMYKEFSPDIILSDIKMPKMDGLELIKEIRESDQRVKIIVLSYYCDFDLVKEALLNGANDYLLKTSINENELLEHIKRQVSNIKLNNHSQELQTKKDRSAIIKALISPLFLEHEPINLHELKIYEKGLYLICGKINDFSQLNSSHCKKDSKLLIMTILNIINDILKNCKGSEITYLEDNLFVILVNMPDKDAEFLTNHDLMQIFNIIQNSIKRFTTLGISFGISLPVNSFKELSEAYHQALNALSHSFYSKNPCIVFFKDINQERSLSIAYLNNLKHVTLNLLINNDFENLKKEMEETCEHLSEGSYMIKEVQFIIQFLQNMLINEYIERCPNSSFTFLSNNDDNKNKNIYSQFNTIYEYIELLKSASLYNNSFSLVIKRAMVFIEQNYMKPNLTQNSVADFLGVSTNYLSALFKKELDINFVDYVNNLKIEKACILLKESSMKIYEISEAIGFENNSYFSRLFKKTKGISPKDYRYQNLVLFR